MITFSRYIDILFPRLCFGCNTCGSYVCSECVSTLLHQTRSSYVTNWPLRNVDMLVSATEYKGMFKRLITVAKYGSYKGVLIDLTNKLMTDEFINTILLKLRAGGSCMICPVPMHYRKKRHRGFNQSECIAKILSTNIGLPIMANYLLKSTETPPQASLSRHQRQENVKGAFILNDAHQLPESVIVVDDVWTTGSTIGEIAHVLRENGVKHVIACTLARKWYNSPT